MWNLLKFLGTLIIDRESALPKFVQFLGGTTVITSIWSNVTEWVNKYEWSPIFIGITSFLGIFYLLMRMYDQYLITKRRKRILKEEIKSELRKEFDV